MMVSQKKVKRRLDDDVVFRGIAPSKEKAGAFIMAGDILVDGQVVYKPDRTVTEDNRIERKEKFSYASRGALKIENAFRVFGITMEGLDALDIGISNGGFTDYMLAHGARLVTGVDVNIQQVDNRLRQDARVRLIKANARHLTPEQIGYEPDVITIDVSFISVTKILPAFVWFTKSKIIALIKPQFEARREQVGKGGVIRQLDRHVDVILDLKKRIEDLRYGITGFVPAGVKGRKGNQEYFFLLEYGKNSTINDRIITDEITDEIKL
ncbi:MAG: TlyA family RNA methyltransferase [Candidatus Omnitrophota bacterium]